MIEGGGPLFQANIFDGTRYTGINLSSKYYIIFLYYNDFGIKILCKWKEKGNVLKSIPRDG